MYVLAILLVLVALARCVEHVAPDVVGPSLLLAASFVAGALSVAYLLWWMMRGRRRLKDPGFCGSSRRMVLGFAGLVLLVLPVIEWVVYNALEARY